MYPKTKREAVERLIEKVEKALGSGEVKGVVGSYRDCPFCQYFAKNDYPYGANVWGIACKRCADTFGKFIGYRKEGDDWPTCLNLTFCGISLEDLSIEGTDENRAFLTALLDKLETINLDELEG